MNKGSKYAKGDAILFLNAGDKLINIEFIKLINYLKKIKTYMEIILFCVEHISLQKVIQDLNF